MIATCWTLKKIDYDQGRKDGNADGESTQIHLTTYALKLVHSFWIVQV